jgi:hypothetical protein
MFSKEALAKMPSYLIEEADNIFADATSSETSSSYHSHAFGVNGYEPVLLSLGADPASLWPASEYSISIWMGYLLKAAQVDAPENFLSGLRSEHIKKGLPWLLHESAKAYVAKLRAGAKNRVFKRRQKSSIVPTPESIFPISGLMLRFWCQNPLLLGSPNGRLFLACSAWAFYACHRGGEIFTPAKRSNSKKSKRVTVAMVFVDPPHLGGSSGVTLRLPFDKTHPTSRVDVWLPSLGEDPTCPIQLLKNSLADRGIRLSDSSPSHDLEALFQTQSGFAVSFEIMRQWTESALLLQGIVMPDNFYISLKSWRRGHISAAERLPPASVREAALKKSGRWSGDSWKSYSSKSRGVAVQVHSLALSSKVAAKSMGSAAKLSDPSAVPRFRQRRVEPFLVACSRVSRAENASAVGPASQSRGGSSDPPAPLARSAEERDSSLAFSDSAESEALAAVARLERQEKIDQSRAVCGKRKRGVRSRLDAGLGW